MQIHQEIYRRALLALLGITKIVSSTERTIPGKWHNVIDSVKVSSQVLHTQLSVVDEEVAEEYQEMETEINRKLGREKLYNKKDLEEAEKMIESVEFQDFNRRI
jgi:hypothetical protein